MSKPLSLTRRLRDWEQSVDSTGIMNTSANETAFKGKKGIRC
jgi:hypothetical protein